MLIVLLASGLGLLSLPGVTRLLGRRMHPDEWSRLCLAAIAAGAAVAELSMVLYAAPTVATALHVPMVEALCRRMLGELTPGGPTAGWTATAAAVVLPTLGTVGWSRAQRAANAVRVERCLGRHARVGPHELVVLPTPQLLAVAVPHDVPRARTGQIVISDGLVDALRPEELGAVVRHEAAHLRDGHHRFLAVATVVDHAFAWLPLARRSTGALRVALERWADEESAAGDEERVVLRRALLTVTASLLVEPSMAAFSAADTIAERLDALCTDAPDPGRVSHVLLYCPGTLFGAIAVGAMLSWASGAGSVLAMAGQCLS